MTDWKEKLHPRDTEGKFAESDRWARQPASGGPAPHVSALAAAEPAVQAEDFWADDEPEMSDAFRAMVAQDPKLLKGYARLKELREAGYTGYADQDGNPCA